MIQGSNLLAIKSTFLFCIIMVFSFCFPARGFTNLGMGGAMLPHRLAAVRNPAYQFYPSRTGYDSAKPFPIGFLGLLPSDRNPFLYFSDKERFIDRFDFLSFVDQITYLNSFLINPAQSPRGVNLRVTPDRLEITDDEGKSLPFGERTGSAGISLGGTPLIPPSLISAPFIINGIFLETGLFLGGGGYSIVPDAELKRAVYQRNLFPDTEYFVDTSASFQAGVRQSVTFPFRWRDTVKSADVYTAVRVLAFYTAAYAEMDLQLSLHTGENAIPDNTKLDLSIFSLRPGSGYGYGVRLDAGLVADYDRWTWGFGILNLLGFCHLIGVETNSFESEGSRESRLFDAFLPQLFTNISYLIPVADSQLILAGDVGYTTDFVAHGGIAYEFGNMHVKTGLGWEGQWRFGFAWGYRFSRWWGEIALTTHRAPFTERRVYGIGVSGGILSESRNYQ